MEDRKSLNALIPFLHLATDEISSLKDRTYHEEPPTYPDENIINHGAAYEM